MKEILDI